MAKAIGIDLGTTKSVVAVVEGKDAKVIPNEHGSNITPSIVAFTDKGERLVGMPAKNQAIINSKNTIYEVKRFMGRRCSECQNERRRVPYETAGEGDEPVKIRAGGKTFTPQEISAMILQELKRTAENYLGTQVKDVVITCPAYFNDSQRQATKEAGMIAGLNVKRIINEPTSASLAYGLDKRTAQKIAVYDLGGGTFDISILEVDKEVIQVLSTNGDTFLGGSDMDQRIVNYVAEEFQKQHGIDLRKDPMALQRLKEAAEKAKIELSTVTETTISLPFITADASGPKHLSISLSRAKFEQLIRDLLDRTIPPIEQALLDARLKPADIQNVVLVGGPTRIPRVQQLVRDFFGRDPHRGVNPEEVVAMGAAIQAAIMSNEMKDILLLDVTPLTLGVETLGGVRTPVIARNTPIPAKRSQVFSTASDGQTQVEIHVLQGEREMASDCRTLGRFHLHGIPPAPRGIPQIEVTFEIDSNGILNVTAQDKGTGKQQSITIQGSTGLSKEEVERMTKEAEKYAEEDRKRREFVDSRNQGEQMIYAMENLLKEHGDKVGEAEKTKVQKAIEKLRGTLSGNSADDIKRAMEELKQSSYELSKHIYEKAGTGPQQASGGQGSEGGKKEGGERVIDADFETK